MNAKLLYEAERGVYMGLNISVQQFVERLNNHNRYLSYFPEENPQAVKSR
jgi:hypothetical protein